jgi:hypothetical protein
MKKKYLQIVIAFLAISYSPVTRSQDFDKTIDKQSGAYTLRFIDKRTPIRIPFIIEKHVDSSKSSVYLVGLYTIINLLPLDFFMSSGGTIVFEDKSILTLKEDWKSLFLSGGKHQISVRHILSLSELKLFQEKLIDNYSIGNINRGIDRFEREYLRQLFRQVQGQ